MTIQQVQEQGLSAAQQDLIELVADFHKEGLNKSELDTRQKTVLIALERKGFVLIAKNGSITLTEKSKEDTKMAAKEDTKMAAKKVEKKVEKIDEKALKAVAKDLNDVLGLEPAIDLKAKDLLDRVKDEAAQVGVDPKTGEVDPKLVAGDKKELQPETWEFLEAQGMLGHLEEEEVEEPVKEKAEVEEKPVAKKAGKKAPVEKAEKAPKVKKEKEQKGPGVIATIAEFVKKATKKKPVTKADILAHLVEAFPEHNEKSMANTINVQLPNRMSKEKGIKIEGTSKDGFYVA